MRVNPATDNAILDSCVRDLGSISHCHVVAFESTPDLPSVSQFPSFPELLFHHWISKPLRITMPRKLVVARMPLADAEAKEKVTRRSSSFGITVVANARILL